MKALQKLGLAALLLVVLGSVPETLQALQFQQKYTSAEVQRVTLSDARAMFYKADFNRKISVSFERETVEQALRQLARQTGLKLTYRGDIMVSKKVTLSARHMSISAALDYILEDTGLDYRFSQNGYLLVGHPEEELIAAAVQETVEGQVTDAETGGSLPGVNIVIKGTSTGTSTDADGRFELSVPSLSDTLVFSFVGYQTREVPINGRNELNVEMELQTVAGDELVVTGYMEQKRADVTGSISSVSSDDLKKRQDSNVLQSLQGKVAGMHVTTDGNPVGNANVQIRGLTSVRSAPPLIVMDGLPTELNLRDINPNDIESIQVLKDASSASIYGSRAASGVILIETNKGTRGQIEINYSGSSGVSSFMNREEMMNTQQYGEALWQAAINDGRDPNSVTQIYDFDWSTNSNGDPVLNEVTPRECLNDDCTMKAADTDWFKEGSQLGLQNDHQLSISQGTDKTRTMFSVGFHENRGTQIHTGFRRISMRLNSDYNLLNGRLTVGENLALSHSKINNQNHSHSFLTMPPIVPVYTEDGGWGGTAYNLGMDDYNNPVRMLTLGKDNDTKVAKILGSAYADLSLTDNLTFKTQFGVDYTSSYYRHVNFTWQEGGGKQDVNNGASAGQTHDLHLTFTNTINYGVDLNNHSIDVLGGIESLRYMREYISGNRQDIEIEDYDYGYLSAATGNQTINGSGNEYALLSFFSKVNYEFDSRYLFSATLRYDGSSKFGENNRFGFFPAVSAGWRLSNEEFLIDNDFISELKIRASWGMNGNSNIPTDALVNYYDADYNATAYAIKGNESGDLESGYRKRHTGNPDLRWEATEQADIGIDFGLLEGRVTGSVDVYHKYTDGMLYEPPYLAAIGEGGHQWINAANMTNRGIEAVLTYRGNFSRDFSYSISGNISSNKNKIDDLPDEVRFAYGGNGLDDDIQGRPLNSFYGFVADGIFKTQEEVDNSPEQPGKGLGRIRYKDLDGDGRITWDYDRTWLGDSDPDIIYGVDFDVNYKNFDFSMFWQGIAGNTVRNDWKTYSDFWNVWTQSGFNHATRLLDAWSPSNPDSDIPALSLTNANDERRLSTYFMESGSYLKLRNIEVGYSPIDLATQLGMKEFRIYAVAENIINLKKWWGDDAYTSIDPENPTKAHEYSSPYVRPQMFRVGVNVSF